MFLLHDITCVNHRGHHKLWIDTFSASVLTLHHQIVTCLVFKEKSYEDTITPMMRHRRLPCASSFREGRASFAWVRIYAFAQRWEEDIQKD